MITIYHNPRCSKSRATLALLEASGKQFNIIRYLDDPPSTKELESICKKLAIAPKELARTGEAVYKTLGEVNDSKWCQILHENPILIERPIVVAGDRAVIGRPPENVIDLLKGI